MMSALTTIAVGLLSYLLDYFILNPEIFLNWNSFRTAVIGAILAYISKNRKKIIAAVKGYLK